MGRGGSEVDTLASPHATAGRVIPAPSRVRSGNTRRGGFKLPSLLPHRDSATGVLWFGVQAMESCRLGASKRISLVIDPNNNGLTNYDVKSTSITLGS
ncbi:unnamed protein product [Linum trigynum]|uniref:Uncharacterized protein n=1 Tax=Linum trigynum TaxID=586398 RepID=A0AAV2FLN7_9ROSI